MLNERKVVINVEELLQVAMRYAEGKMTIDDVISWLESKRKEAQQEDDS